MPTIFIYCCLKIKDCFSFARGQIWGYNLRCCLLVFMGFNAICSVSSAQETDAPLIPAKMKKLSIEELMNIEIEVTTVSKRPEKLAEAASAIQVITQEDIRRSGATSLPEALRLASNLQVAQANSSQWAISARGFNNVLANKLLVMIDGRTVYTPLYAGVFWDVQNLILEDVARIEVVSGPGGSLWGANAVNGVINIITKNSKETKGLYAEAAMGTELLSLGSLRYGGQLADHFSYRVYGTAFKRGSTINPDNSDPHDAWTMGQGGFRMDWDPSKKDVLTLQSNFYDGRPDPEGLRKEGGIRPVIARGGNILSRWNHTVSEKSDFQIQVYYDQTWRDFRNKFTEDLKTYDLDGQHRFQFGQRHGIVWGLGLRVMEHTTENLELFGFFPSHKTLHIYSAFVQDEIALIKERLSFTLGSKFEHNNYVGFQYQPSCRLTWRPLKHQTIWAAVSRAIRTPARIDREFTAYLAPGIPGITGSPNFKPEELIAYELGWRLQPMEKFSISLSAFYNVYDNIRSAEPGLIIYPFPITYGNGVKGNTYGIELSAAHQLAAWWHLRGGYTFLRKELSVKSNSADLNKASAESNDPEHQLLLQSSMNLPHGFELGTVARYVHDLPKPTVPGYLGLDIRLGWKLNKILELNVTGQNLLDDHHTEFIPTNSNRKIQRGIYGKIICRL
jgi:iron complex outermembrane receptor protein